MGLNRQQLQDDLDKVTERLKLLNEEIAIAATAAKYELQTGQSTQRVERQDISKLSDLERELMRDRDRIVMQLNGGVKQYYVR